MMFWLEWVFHTLFFLSVGITTWCEMQSRDLPEDQMVQFACAMVLVAGITFWYIRTYLSAKTNS